MDVEALLFDVGGTVFDWSRAVSSALQDLGNETWGGVDGESFGAEWRKQSLIEIMAVAEESAPWRPFQEVLESSLDRTLGLFAVPALAPRDRQALLAAWEVMPVWPEVPAALSRLRQRYFVAPHTILSLRAAAFSSRSAGLTWDAVISCDALGATKPNPESYRRALALLGRPAERVCFVAAHPGDLRAARQHGMKTAYVVARLEDYGDDYEDRGFAQEFDLVAEDFTDLAAQMTC